MFHRTYFLFQIVSFLGNRIIGVLPSPNFGIASPLPNGLTPLLRIRWFRVTYCEHWDRLCPGCMRAVVLVLWSAGLRLLIGRAVCWSFMFPAGRSNLSSCACMCVCGAHYCQIPQPVVARRAGLFPTQSAWLIAGIRRVDGRSLPRPHSETVNRSFVGRRYCALRRFRLVAPRQTLRPPCHQQYCLNNKVAFSLRP